MQPFSYSAITIDPVKSAIAKEKKCNYAVLRLDKIHPEISGNKIFKLKYYLEKAITDKKGMLTWGGAFSNHILATAAACKLNNLQCIGIIRGEEPAAYSYTLLQAKDSGMQLHFISRESYKQKIIPKEIDIQNYVNVNEGGYGNDGAKGASAITEHFANNQYTHIISATGTGTTLAGLVNATNESTKIIGISVMKNNLELEEQTKSLLFNKTSDFKIIHDYHFGGYAKHTGNLISFMNLFYEENTIPSDFVYTAKAFYAVDDLLKKDYFPVNSNILVIHTGGLQGNLSLNKGTLIF